MQKILLLITLLLWGATANAQLFGRHWKTGAYYDKKGVKHEGLVAEYTSGSTFSTAVKNFHFKATKNGEDVKINCLDIQALVVKHKDNTIDSFTVSKQLAAEGKPLLAVIIDNPVKLFIAIIDKSQPSATPGAYGGKYTSYTYYVGDTPNQVVELTKKNFITMMSRVMTDKPEVVKKIENKEDRKGDIEDLIIFYKTGAEPPKPWENN